MVKLTLPEVHHYLNKLAAILSTNKSNLINLQEISNHVASKSKTTFSYLQYYTHLKIDTITLKAKDYVPVTKIPDK